jgi:hypothetical protein
MYLQTAAVRRVNVTISILNELATVVSESIRQILLTNVAQVMS